jgi:hypothetical protein
LLTETGAIAGVAAIVAAVQPPCEQISFQISLDLKTWRLVMVGQSGISLINQSGLRLCSMIWFPAR